MITITQDEVNAFNIISARAEELQGLLQQALAAKKAVMSLLEVKYNAVYDTKTAKLIEKPEEKK